MNLGEPVLQRPGLLCTAALLRTLVYSLIDMLQIGSKVSQYERVIERVSDGLNGGARESGSEGMSERMMGRKSD